MLWLREYSKKVSSLFLPIYRAHQTLSASQQQAPRADREEREINYQLFVDEMRKSGINFKKNV